MFSRCGNPKSHNMTVAAVLIAVTGGLALMGARPGYCSPVSGFPETQRETSQGCSSSQTFSGEVRRSEDYEHEIKSGLVFRLVASHDPANEGWQIEITPKTPEKDGRYRDWAWPLNPPYRGYNAQNVNVAYDFTAKEAVKYPRSFRFPLNDADAKRALELSEKLESSTGPELDSAMKALSSFPSGTGEFKITDSRLTPSVPDKDKAARIEWLKFTVSISLPCQSAENTSSRAVPALMSGEPAAHDDVSLAEIHKRLTTPERLKYHNPVVFVGEISSFGTVYQGVCKQGVGQDVAFSIARLLWGNHPEATVHTAYINCTRQPLPSPPFTLNAKVIVYCEQRKSSALCLDPVAFTDQRAQKIESWITQIRNP